MKQRTIYLTMRLDYDEHKEVTDSEASAAWLAQESVQARDTSIIGGIHIQKAEICHIEDEYGKDVYF